MVSYKSEVLQNGRKLEAQKKHLEGEYDIDFNYMDTKNTVICREMMNKPIFKMTGNFSENAFV